MKKNQEKKLHALVASYRSDNGSTMYISNQVAPDLLIRTVGEVRISVDQLNEIVKTLTDVDKPNDTKKSGKTKTGTNKGE